MLGLNLERPFPTNLRVHCTRWTYPHPISAKLLCGLSRTASGTALACFGLPETIVHLPSGVLSFLLYSALPFSVMRDVPSRGYPVPKTACGRSVSPLSQLPVRGP